MHPEYKNLVSHRLCHKVQYLIQLLEVMLIETVNEILTDAQAGTVPDAQPVGVHAMLERINLSTPGHIFFVVFGIVLLILILLAVRHELKYLATANPSSIVKSLSFISFAHMFALSFVIIFHFYFNLPVLAGVVIIIAVILLIITPVQVVLRMRAFSALREQRIAEKTKMMMDVTNILDKGKREVSDKSEEESKTDESAEKGKQESADTENTKD